MASLLRSRLGRLTERDPTPTVFGVTERDAVPWRTLGGEERQRLIDAAAQVFAKAPWVAAAYLYGSAIRDQRPARDIDIGLVVARIPSRREESSIARQLSEMSGTAWPLDLRVLNGASPVFLAEVLRDGVLIYEADREARIRFQTHAVSQWLDFRPVWERTRRRVLERWSRG